MDWLSRMLFPNQPEHFRRQQCRQLVVVTVLALIFCIAAGVGVWMYFRVRVP